MKRLPLTIIILTHLNDDRFIKALQISQFAQEVLIIDYQSKNDWANLKKKCAFQLIKKNQPITDFSQARNQTLKLAHFEWVFFLDSDEYLEQNSINQIGKLIQSVSNETAAIKIKRLDIFHQQVLFHGEANQNYIRLMKKNCAQFYRPVHEKVNIKGKIEKSEIIIYHQAHRSINDFIDRINFYTQLEAAYRKQKSTDSIINKIILVFQLIIYPIAKFIYNYFFRLAVLDGFAGFVYSYLMSIHSLCVRVNQLN